MRYVKLFAFLTLLLHLDAIGSSSGQIKLKDALHEIERAYEVKFNYNETIVENLIVNEGFRHITPLGDQLNQLLKPHSLSFKKLDQTNFIIVKNAQNKVNISGKVTDNSGFGLPGVTILEKGTSNGTVTDFDGNYTMLVDESASITYSFVGFKTQEINVAGRSTIDVIMEDDVQALDEVVVIGYGSVKKSDLTGSLSSISSDEITKVATSSLDQALQGRAAGVQVRQVTGKPGGGTSIRIRGTSSITAGNEPLYVIDGMMITSSSDETTAGGNLGVPVNPLAAINPSDIESIEILKDASATAIYGSRGSNGVVLVTTKKGKSGNSQISFDSYYGIQQIRKQLDVLNGEQFATLINEVRSDQGLALDPKYLVPEDYGEGTDWQDVMFRDAPIQSYGLSFSGGDEKSTYLLSLGYFSQDGIIVGSEFNRFNIRSNLTRKVNERIDVGSNLGITRIYSKGVLTNFGTLLPGVSMTALLFPPTQPVLDPNVAGGYTYEDNRGRGLANPYADANEVDDNTTNLRAIGSVYTTVELIKNLKYKLNFGFDYFTSKENRFVPNYLRRTALSNGEATVATINGGSWLLEHTLSYNKDVGDHHFDGVVGFTTQKFISERLFALSLDFADNKTGYHAIQNSSNPQPSSTGRNEWGLLSYLARINYIYKDRYLFTVNGRIDGSSKFGENYKYGVFPSGSFAWRISNEAFWPQNEVFTNLKGRFSYGVIGNSEIGTFQSIPTIQVVGEGTFNNDEPYNGLAPDKYADPNLRWERANQADVGLDMEFFSGKVSTTVDYYYRLTSDLLLNNQLPSTTGFETSLTNVGSVINRGVEWTVNSVNVDKEFFWSTNFNISFNRNEVDKLATDNDVFLGGALYLPTGWSILREGESLGTFFGYKSDGLFQSDAEIAEGPLLSSQSLSGSAKPGDRRYKDLESRNTGGQLEGDADGIINEADRTVIGNANPDFTWAITNTFKYKGFDLSIFIQGSQGNDVINANLFEIANLNAETNVLTEYYVNAWSAENPNNKYPRINQDRNAETVFSDAFVEDGSFARLQNVTLGYTFPSRIMTPVGISKLRVYISGNNLVTLTQYSGFDPEVNAFGNSSLFQLYQGIDYGGYPTTRSYIAGLQLTF